MILNFREATAEQNRHSARSADELSLNVSNCNSLYNVICLSSCLTANRLAFEIETSKRYLKSNEELEGELTSVCRERDDVRVMFEEVSSTLLNVHCEIDSSCLLAPAALFLQIYLYRVDMRNMMISDIHLLLHAVFLLFEAPDHSIDAVCSRSSTLCSSDSKPLCQPLRRVIPSLMTSIPFLFIAGDLEEERMEGKAIRLRLSVQEAQAAEYRQHMQNLQNEQERNEAFSLGAGCPLLFHTETTSLSHFLLIVHRLE